MALMVSALTMPKGELAISFDMHLVLGALMLYVPIKIVCFAELRVRAVRKFLARCSRIIDGGGNATSNHVSSAK